MVTYRSSELNARTPDGKANLFGSCSPGRLTSDALSGPRKNFTPHPFGWRQKVWERVEMHPRNFAGRTSQADQRSRHDPVKDPQERREKLVINSSWPPIRCRTKSNWRQSMWNWIFSLLVCRGKHQCI